METVMNSPDSLSIRASGRRYLPAKLFFRENNIGNTKGYELVRTGQLDALRIGTKILIRDDALDQLQQRQNASDARS